MKRDSYRKRFLVMLAVLVIAAVGYFLAGGIGNICAVGFDTITLLCPLGALLAMLAEKTAIPLAVISVVVVLLICVVLGKVFCSWVCPVHFMTHPKASKRAKKKKDNQLKHAGCAACSHPCGKSKGIKLDSRHGVLAAALGSTLIFGFPVFCLICPVGLTFATVLLVMRLFAFGETTWTIIAFIAIIAAEVFLLPKWCHKFCPLGALLSLFSGANKTFVPTVNPDTCLREAHGKDCNLCERACPEGINLHDVALGSTTLNDCSKCLACADACPQHSITFPFLPAQTQKNDQRDVVE